MLIIIMYPYLLILHSLWRWLVLASLCYSIFLALKRKYNGQPFDALANRWRHWTATIAHVQLLLGMAVYIQSPIVKYKLANNPAVLFNEQYFFRYFHLAMMVLAIVFITIGSAKAKREKGDSEKYTTMLIWFCLALAVIFIAIPWPFSPLANRPYFRTF